MSDISAEAGTAAGGAAAAMPPRPPGDPADPAELRSSAVRRPRRGRARGRRELRPYLATGLAVTAVLLAAATVLLALAVLGSADAAQQRAAVLTAAQQEAVNLTTLDHQSAARQFAAVLAGSAGSLRQQLAQGRGAFLRTLSSAAVSSAGTVLDAGIVTMSARTATVLLNVRATVRNKQTYAPETRLYHWQAGLVYSGGRWLVTSVEFV